MGPVLIKAGRVYDGLAEDALEHAYVIIEGATITAVGRQGELVGSAGRFAREIDLGPEVTVLPGLINMHTHMSFSAGEKIMADHQRESNEIKLIRSVDNLKAALGTGVTTVRDCGTLNSIAFAVREAIESGITMGPRVIASGGGITTTGGHLWFNGIEADNEAEVRRAVRSQVKAGADFIKIFATGGGSTPGTNSLAAQYSEAEMCAITEEARRLGRRTAAHVHGTPGVYTSIAARVTTIEHCSFLTPAGVRYEPEQAQRIADAGIFVCPTVFQGKSKFFPRDPAQLPAEDKEFLEQREQRFAMLRQMVAQGIRMVSGSDAGVTCNTFTDYPGDLMLMVEGVDLTPTYVIKSATSVAAEALGRDDLGVIASGKAADLLAVQGNPLQNIRALEQPRLVVARGRLVA